MNRCAFDRIIAAGGFISVPTGSAPDGNAIPVPKDERRSRHGRGRLHRLRRLRGRLSQRRRRAVHRRQDRASRSAAAGPAREGPPRLAHGGQMNDEMFGSCTNIGECEAVCPKVIRLEVIARMNRDYLKASWSNAASP